MLARLAFFLLLIAPPIALAADTPPGGGKITVVAPPPKAAAAPTRTAISTIPPPPAAPRASADASSCRMDCAQSYYVCRAGEDSEACAPTWSQCAAACTSPNLASAADAPG
jgi:hypothetical protein